MNKVDMIKSVGNFVISVGVGAIVNNAIKHTSPSSVSGIKNLCVGIGAFVLSNMVSDKATTYAEGKIDSAVKSVKEMVENGELE